MEAVISNLISRFETGSLSRRELVQGLALLAAGGTSIGPAGAAADDVDFSAADIDHISIHVTDLQRSTDFYQKLFGFKVVSEDRPQGIVRLGNSKVLVSLNNGRPAGMIDHFAIGVPQFNAQTGARYFTQRGATPMQGDYAGFHIKDPDGINVQISRT